MTVAYLFTTFPKSTETFLQREVAAMQERGVGLRLYSLWGGGGEFRGLPVVTFNKWRLLTLVWVIPWTAIVFRPLFFRVLRGLFTRRAPSALNFGENLLGAGFAALFYPHFRRNPPDLLHAAWGGAPATAAWLLSQMEGYRFSAAAHAYDLYEHGGDWWLNEKLAEAAFIHTSTAMGRAELLRRGLPAARIHVLRRGLESFPACKPLRAGRDPLRIICIARLVEKKGIDHQLALYAHARARGLRFEARILGEGPLRGRLEAQARRLGLGAVVTFCGHQEPSAVWAALEWADVLVHTGVVATSGDRDGLPNVIPEALSVGVMVVTSPAAATTEAVTDGVTGRVVDVLAREDWYEAWRQLADDDAVAERFRRAGRAWVEEHYDAHKQAARLAALFESAVESRER